MTLMNGKATCACLNYSVDYCPEDIAIQQICLSGDIGNTIKQMKRVQQTVR